MTWNVHSTDRGDVVQTRFHHGILPVGASYTETVSFQVPHAIHGNYTFIVVTDINNAVFENTFENDNRNSTQVNR